MATPFELKAKYEVRLMSIPGVTGVGATSDRVIVYVAAEWAMYRLPKTLEGVPVQAVVTGGEFKPLG